MPISLTPVVGPERSRSLKKAAAYATIGAGSFVLGCVVYTLLDLFRAHYASLWAILLAIIAAFVGRLWVKYTHNQAELHAAQDRIDRMQATQLHTMEHVQNLILKAPAQLPLPPPVTWSASNTDEPGSLIKERTITPDELIKIYEGMPESDKAAIQLMFRKPIGYK